MVTNAKWWQAPHIYWAQEALDAVVSDLQYQEDTKTLGDWLWERSSPDDPLPPHVQEAHDRIHRGGVWVYREAGRRYAAALARWRAGQPI